MVEENWQRLGLDVDHPLVQSESAIDVAGIHCVVSEAAGVVTVHRA